VKAIRFDGEGVSLHDVPIPEAADEALVRVLAAGVCNTDLEIVRGYAGFRGTLGHEFVGVVERCSDASLLGTRVVGEINCGCGTCERCRGGDARHCTNRTVLGIVGRDGAMAEYVALPEGNLLVVPENIATEHAVFVEPLAAAAEILDQLALASYTRVALIGDGKLGQLIARVLSAVGCEVTAIGKHDAKLDLLERGGAIPLRLTDVVGPDGGTRSPHRRGYQIVVEASGSSRGIALAQDLVEPRGTIVLKSTISEPLAIDATRLVVDEVGLLGSRCGRFAPALAMLAERRVDVAPLVSAVMDLDAGVTAIETAATPGVLKVIVACGM
jgi:threonine dehydrogenase-like Zn-dependent dehydrogenase